MSMKVLIADPDWRFAKNATSFLESRAHLVVHHTRHDEAIETARHWRPDLAIVSEELCDTGLIKQLYSLQPRPAVLLVGWMDRYDRIWRAWQRGGDELLVKPIFSSKELLEAIVSAMENAVTGRRGRTAAASA